MKSTFLKKYPLSLLAIMLTILSAISSSTMRAASCRNSSAYTSHDTTILDHDAENHTEDKLDQYIHTYFQEAFFTISPNDKRSFHGIISDLVTFINDNKNLLHAKLITRGIKSPTLNQFIHTLESVQHEKNALIIAKKLNEYIHFLPQCTQDLLKSQTLKLLSGLKKRLSY